MTAAENLKEKKNNETLLSCQTNLKIKNIQSSGRGDMFKLLNPLSEPNISEFQQVESDQTQK